MYLVTPFFQFVTSCLLFDYVMSNVIQEGWFTKPNNAIATSYECAFKCLPYNYNGTNSSNKCECVGFESTVGSDCKLLKAVT